MGPPRVLLFADYYLPGYKAGGPIRTLANLIESLGDEFAFQVVTRDRDAGEDHPYSGVQNSDWQPVGKASLLYLPPNRLGLSNIRQIVRRTSHDVLYLNSFFSPVFTVQTLLLRRAGLIPRSRVLLAPRGEFSPEALRLKLLKKKGYLRAARLLGLCRDVLWQASSEHEKQQIYERVGNRARVFIAPDLTFHTDHTFHPHSAKRSGHLRAVFLSRISPMKNLHGALQLLTGLSGTVLFHIYGPIRDEMYRAECKRISSAVPANVAVEWHDSVPHERVPSLLAHYDLLFLPTLGENFGHVIHEALAAGCPVLISDRTPWRDLAAKGIGWDLPIDQPSLFRSALQTCIDMDEQTFRVWSDRARKFAVYYALHGGSAESNRDLFRAALFDSWANRLER